MLGSSEFQFPNRDRTPSIAAVLPSKNWRLENVSRLFLTLTVFWLLSGAVAMSLAAARKQQGAPLSPLVLLAITGLGFHGAGMVLVHAFLRAEKSSWIHGFGLRNQPAAAVRLAVGATLVVVPGLYVLHHGMAYLLTRWGWMPSPQESVELLLRSGWGGRAVIALFAVVLAPVAEESLFRGIFFPALRDAGWPRASGWIVSLVFGLIHGNAAAFLPLAAFGGFLAWLYVRTGNLLAPITAHFVFNLLPFLLVAMGVDFGG